MTLSQKIFTAYTEKSSVEAGEPIIADVELATTSRNFVGRMGHLVTKNLIIT